MSAESTPAPEIPKHIVSSHWWHFLFWHVWTFLSVLISGILLWLNFSQYAIGGELGTSSGSSADIIGALQLGIKAHELLIVASLITIARQMIIGNLLDGGLVLGLLGAESALTTPSFIVTEEFRQSFLFGCRKFFNSESPINRQMFWLSLFVLWACILSSLAGPASGVLMIPRVDWHRLSKQLYTPPSFNTYPNIMIGSGGDNSSPGIFESGVGFFPGLNYWEYYFDNAAWDAILASDDDLFHRFVEGGVVAYINTTGTYGRELDGTWSGGTNITCGMASGSAEVRTNTWEMSPTPMNETKNGWRAVKSTINLVTLNSVVTCRARERIPCTPTSTLSGNYSDPDWCYTSVGDSFSSGTLRTSRNLLLAADYGTYNSRVWITEGPRIAANNHYSDSIEVIFEQGPLEDLVFENGETSFNLTVCTFSGALVSGIGTALGTHFASEKIEYFNYALTPNGTQAPPRRILFHENWLDRAYAVDGEQWDNISSVHPDPFSYPARPRTIAPPHNVLAAFGNTIRDVGSYYNGTEALPAEVAVGGALAYLLSWTPGSDSQFAMRYEDIPSRFTDGLGPRESWTTEYVYKVYQEGFMFRLSTRTGYLGVLVLGLHAITAILASLWQLFVTRRVILGWTNTPEYMMLGAGSHSLTAAYPNTCAGIAAKGALGGIIMLKETIPNTNSSDTTSEHLNVMADSKEASFGARPDDRIPHLEIVACNPESVDRNPESVDRTGKVNFKDTTKKYGFDGGRRGSGKI